MRRAKENMDDVAMKQFRAGWSMVAQHPMFSPLAYHVGIVRQKGNLCPEEGWAVVTRNGVIHVHPTRRAQPEEWLYILAHCMLHLGFGHFQEKTPFGYCNAACDCIIAQFLAEMKLGKPPTDWHRHISLPKRQEEQLFAQFYEQGLPAGMQDYGTAGTGRADMVMTREEKKDPGNPRFSWQNCLVQGLSMAVTSAVKVAGGYEAFLGADVLAMTPAKAAKNWFINSFPLLGALAASFDIIEDPVACRRMDISVAAVCAESKEIYMNPAAGLDEWECRFVMAHEIMHVGLAHRQRRKGRDPYLWNVACDYVINGWLIEMGLGELPKIGALYDPELKGLSAEAVYDRIVTDVRRYRKLATLRGTGLGDMLEGENHTWWSTGDGIALDEFYRRSLAQGLTYHEQDGRGFLPAGLVEEIRALSQPPIPWDVELAQWFDQYFSPLEKKRSYARPSRRQSSAPDIPRPSWVPSGSSEDGRTFGVILDTSGSMDRALLAKALGAIASYSISREVPAVRVVFCDAATYDQGYMVPEAIADRVQVRGRGGTVLQPAALPFGYWMISKSEPVTNGQIAVSGLTQQVSVYRDGHGVPTIQASNLQDLYIAQGYVTAQDRLFQMDLSRRQASGQLSEVVGSVAIAKDKFFRTLGLRRAAEASWGNYSEEAKQILTWYAKGVNAFLEESVRDNKLPIEFTLLGYQPQPWTPIDSLAIGKYMAYDLGGNWEAQAFRYYLLQNFPADKAFDLFPSYPVDAPTIIEAAQASNIDMAKSFASAVIPEEWNGSNNWVLSAEKSASGKPILANDPHLSLSTPAIWYETQLIAPDMEVSGVIFAGIPGVILGNNRQIAWGVTNVGPDVQDLYIEERNPQNKNEFKYMGKWEPAQVLTEEIKVKGEASIPYEVVITRHGPIISEFAHDEKPGQALALKWTALAPTTELQALLQFNRAKNWDEFKQALTYFQAPAQNFVFASIDGTIAYRANGQIPIRKKGDGAAPVPGWTDEYEWSGYIPWEKLPTAVNPPAGFIATANNKVVSDAYPYHLSHTWAQPYRHERILEVLNSKPKWKAEELKQLQLDQKNLQAEQLLPILLPRLEQSELRAVDKEAIELLKSWDHYDRTDSAAPLVFNLWMITMQDTLFADEINPDMYALFLGKGQAVDKLVVKSANGEEGTWIKAKGGLSKMAINSFQKAHNPTP
ncbi:MAG: penicillin acylase family protein, partial [Clostridia bacterium]